VRALKTHGRYPYSAITRRPDYSWPGKKRLAVYIGFNLEHFDFGAGLGAALGPKSPEPDVLNFSSLAERVSPARAVDILNRYYALWATMAERHRGRLAGITGDTVILVFGLLGEKDASERAVACALDFQAELPGLRDDLAAASLPPLEAVSIGIHAGPIVAGELGVAGSRRLGVFGDAVSVASRLDSLCREFKQDLLLSQPVFRQLGLESQTKFLRLGEVLLRNSTQPVPVYGTK